MGLGEMIKVRPMAADDADALGLVMWDAIRHGHSRYTSAQRKAWQPEPPQGLKWAAKLGGQRVWVACAHETPLGFLTLADGGYVELAFVASQKQGQGVFSALYAALEAHARKCGVERLWTHSSLMAEPAFAARGFHVIARETVERSGETLARAGMEKVLT